MPDDAEEHTAKKKHTPGPWHVVSRPWDEKGCTVNTTEDPHVGKLICDTSLSNFLERDEMSLETMRANAKLIAAAPELMNACEKITEAISPYTRTPGATPDPAMYASRVAFHAIAKARVLPPKFTKLPDQDERDPDNDNERSEVGLTSAGKEVADLRDENERLKERIEELEGQRITLRDAALSAHQILTQLETIMGNGGTLDETIVALCHALDASDEDAAQAEVDQ